MKKAEIVEALRLGEDGDWEFKDGRGGFGPSFVQSMSAFANTAGGVIVCGIRSSENDTVFTPIGVPDPKRYVKNFWDTVHSGDAISYACCGAGDAWIETLDGQPVVCIRVPVAPRNHRPVFRGRDPYSGTFKRRDSGDYRCTREEINRMMRDASPDPQDAAIVADTSMADIDVKSLERYRNLFSARKPDHAFLGLENKALLRKLGGWRKDSGTGEEGLTIAGALMFGTEDAVRAAANGLFLDFYERSTDDTRYEDRITSDDGDWEPNLFNFYFAAYPRLVKGLRVPFALDREAMRKGETRFHAALREATVNALIHADFRSEGKILIAKKPGAFVFQNPGRSLTPIKKIMEARDTHGDLSEVRNPHLLRMFYMLGLAERQGSGYPTIFKAWEEGKRHSPHVEEDLDRNIVMVTLPLLSELSPETEVMLRALVGPEYAHLSKLDKDILLHAHQFEETSSETFCSISNAHRAEASGRMRYMANRGWLRRVRPGGYAIGKLESMVWSEGLFGESTWGGDPLLRKGEGTKTLEALLNRIREGAAYRPEIEDAIVLLCDGKYMTTTALAQTLGRRSITKFQTNYIAPLVASGRLEPKFKGRATTPGQAYRAAKR